MFSNLNDCFGTFQVNYIKWRAIRFYAYSSIFIRHNIHIHIYLQGTFCNSAGRCVCLCKECGDFC